MWSKSAASRCPSRPQSSPRDESPGWYRLVLLLGAASDGCDQVFKLGNRLSFAASIRTLRSGALADTSVQQSHKDEWRDHVLSEIVTFLSENKQQIHARYLEQRQGQLPRDLIEQEGLMDFELALTFLEDKPKGFGLGLGFFKANLIR